MMRQFLGWWLWLANARMGKSSERFAAYQVKDRILRRWGARTGEDIQHIVKHCWDCGGNGEDRYSDGECYRCSGTGVYDQFWTTLERWELGGRVFHRPNGFASKPAPGTTVIEGRIEHRHVRDGVSDEALLWLLFTFDRAAWRRLMLGARRFDERVGPMLWLQTLAWKVRIRDWVALRHCIECGRRFWRPFRVHDSWHCCWRCARLKRAQLLATGYSSDDVDLPF